MIALDAHKILSQPSDEKKAQAVCENIEELLGQYPENEIFSGIFAALVVQNIQMSEYLQLMSKAFQGVCLMIGSPAYPVDFEAFVEMRDMTPEEKKKYRDDSATKLMAEIKAREKKIITLEGNQDINAMIQKP